MSKGRSIVTLALLAFALAGCQNPDAPTSAGTQEGLAGSPGEPQPPAPTPPSAYVPVGVRSTPQSALLAFAALYVNWDYRTLAARQRMLAAMSLGAARAAELQAAASSAGDQTLQAARIRNSGVVLGLAPDRSARGRWVLVTREQTTGSAGYAGLEPSDHVTLARLVRTGAGYAVSEWLPQS